MGLYILKRFLYGVLSLFLIATLSFAVICMKPGDPLAQKAAKMPAESKARMEAKYGLDQPMYVRYFKYMEKLVTTGNLGDSVIYDGRTVNDLLKKNALISAQIGIIAIFLQVLLGVPLGLWAALKRGRLTDQVIRVATVLFICVPSFVFCALLQYVFAFKAGLFPLVGWGGAKYMVLPIAAYVLGGLPGYCKYMRSSTIAVLNEDYIETAKAKGVGTTRLIFKHVLRNAILPIVTIVPVAVGGVFGGSMVVENFFAISGMGQSYVRAVNDNDALMILGMTIFFAVTYIISLFFVDVLYGIVDPRIRIVKSKQKGEA